jgi:peptide/nickel transport system permease protein
MIRYAARRIAGLIPVFFGITLVSFLVIHLAPGSAADAPSGFNSKMTAEAKLKLEQHYELDKPVRVQYIHWLKRLFRLDFGRSFTDGEKVEAKIARAIPVTLLINALSLLVIVGFGTLLGVFAALRAGRPADHLLTFLVLAGFSVPTFWLALLAMSFFGVRLHWLPVSGLTSVNFEDFSAWGKMADVAAHLALPVLVSSLTGLAGVSRFMRSRMIEILNEPFIRAARAKGLSHRTVVFSHALRNAVLPLVTILGLSLPGLLGGSVIFESIFSIPGMGRLFFGSVFSRDYPVIMGILVLGAALTLLGNLLADISYALADPRIRLGRERS